MAPLPRGARRAASRSCSSSRISTGPTMVCSTSSTTSRTGRPDVPILVVGTARPELLDRRPGWGGGKLNATTLALSPLADDEAAQIIARAARAGAALGRHAAGASGARRRQPPVRGAVRAAATSNADPTDDLPLPETIQGIIAARLDGLARRGEAAAPGRSGAREGVLVRARCSARTTRRGGARTCARTRSSEKASSAANAGPPSAARTSSRFATCSFVTSLTVRSTCRPRAEACRVRAVDRGTRPPRRSCRARRASLPGCARPGARGRLSGA